MATLLVDTSLIICTRNRPRHLWDLIESVFWSDAVPNEIIVVDDSDVVNSDLVNLVVPIGCELRYLWTRSTGLSRANNDGIRAARYDVLVFTQDDVVVSKTWFRKVVQALQSAPPRTVVTGRVRPGEPETEGAFAPSTVNDSESVIYKGRIGKDVLYLQNAAFYRSIVDDIGLFDERIGPGTEFPGAEDNDFGWRLLKAGYSIMYCNDAVVVHRAWRDEAARPALTWNYGRAQGAFYAKYLSFKDSHMLKRLSCDLVRSAGRIPVRMLAEQRLPFAEVIYFVALIAGVIGWMRRYDLGMGSGIGIKSSALRS